MELSGCCGDTCIVEDDVAVGIDVYGVHKIELLLGHQMIFAAAVLASLVAGAFGEATAAEDLRRSGF